MPEKRSKKLYGIAEAGSRRVRGETSKWESENGREREI